MYLQNYSHPPTCNLTRNWALIQLYRRGRIWHLLSTTLLRHQSLSESNETGTTSSGRVWGEQGFELVRELGRQLTAVNFDPRSTSFLRQRISLAVQRGNAFCVLATLKKKYWLNIHWYSILVLFIGLFIGIFYKCNNWQDSHYYYKHYIIISYIG